MANDKRDKVKDEVAEKFKDLKKKDWDKKVKKAKCHKRTDAVLNNVCDGAADLLPKLRKILLEVPYVNVENRDGTLKSVAEVLVLRARQIARQEAKIEHILSKFAACDRELQDRTDGTVTREDLI